MKQFEGRVPKETVDAYPRDQVEKYARMLAILRAIANWRSLDAEWTIENIPALEKEFLRYQNDVQVMREFHEVLNDGSLVYRVDLRQKNFVATINDDIVALCVKQDFWWLYESENTLVLEKENLSLPTAVSKWLEGRTQREVMEQCEGIVVIGVASKKGISEREEERAAKRARNFAQALGRGLQSIEKMGEKKMWVLNIGQYNGEQADDDKQRPVIVLGIKRIHGSDLGSKVTAALRELALPSWIKLENYTRGTAAIEPLN